MKHRKGAYARIAAVMMLPLVFWGTSLAVAQTTTVAGTTPGQFAVSESGAATYRIPIQVPPGVAGMEPKLELSYNSQSGNGLLGVGWSLGGLSAITRCARTMAQDNFRGNIDLDMNDRYCMDGQRLVLVSGTYGVAGSEYRTELDSFNKIVASGVAGNGVAFFTVQTKAGLKMEYGNTADSRIEAQGKATVRVWAVNKISDVKSNFMTFSYIEDNANGDYNLSKIDYTGNFASGAAPSQSVQFTYEARPDIELSYLAGSVLSMPRRVASIKTFNASSMVREYKVGYEQGTATQRSRPGTVTECSGSGGCLPPVALTASDSASASFAMTGSLTPYPEWTTPIVADFNGDGSADMLINTNTPGAGWRVYISNGDGTFRWAGSLTPYSEWSTPTIADFNGDGLADVLINTNTPGAGWHVYLSNGNGTFSLASFLTPYSEWTTPVIADFNGDGKSDVLINTNTPGAGWQVYLSNGDGSFALKGSLTPYREWTTPVIADFNGDGLSDVLINTNTPGAGWYVYLSKGNGLFGWASALTPYFEWTTPVIADFNGDGLADVLINTNTPGAGWYVYQSYGNGTFGHVSSLTPYFQWTSPIIADFNGDGKSDVLINTNTADAGWYVYLSKGDGGFSYSGSLTPYYQWTTPLIADFNGDGKADVLINTTTPGAGWYVYLSRGNGAFRYAGSLTPYYQWTTPIIADFNGDGRSDVLINTTSQGAGWYTYVAPNGLPDFLTAINSGLGDLTTISRKFLTDSAVYTKDISPTTYPKINLRYPQSVVSTVSSSNGIGGTTSTQYTYGGLKAELGTGRGMLGFRWIKSKNLANNIESYTEFNQDWPLIGTVAKSETRLAGSGNAGVLKRTTNAYAQRTGSAGGSLFVHPSQSIEESWDLGGSAYPTVTSSYQYGQSPQYGDPTQVSMINGAGAGKTTVNEYWPANTGSGNWILGRLKKASVTSVAP